MRAKCKCSEVLGLVLPSAVELWHSQGGGSVHSRGFRRFLRRSALFRGEVVRSGGEVGEVLPAFQVGFLPRGYSAVRCVLCGALYQLLSGSCAGEFRRVARP